VIDPAATQWAGIYADGGSTGGPSTGLPDEEALIIAEGGKFVMAHLFQVPNQPIVFADDPSHRERTEDALIAWGWLHFLKNPTHYEWLPRLPMVKTVVKAMDAIQQFLPTIGKPMPAKFLIAGASKRGWTTWLTPAVDSRVQAIVPMVMPVLNMGSFIGSVVNSNSHFFSTLH